MEAPVSEQAYLIAGKYAKGVGLPALRFPAMYGSSKISAMLAGVFWVIYGFHDCVSNFVQDRARIKIVPESKSLIRPQLSTVLLREFGELVPGGEDVYQHCMMTACKLSYARLRPAQTH